MRTQHVWFNVDRETWKEFKAACAHYGISITGTLTKHIQNIANDYRKDKVGLSSTQPTKREKGRK